MIHTAEVDEMGIKWDEQAGKHVVRQETVAPKKRLKGNKSTAQEDPKRDCLGLLGSKINHANSCNHTCGYRLSFLVPLLSPTCRKFIIAFWVRTCIRRRFAGSHGGRGEIHRSPSLWHRAQASDVLC